MLLVAATLTLGACTAPWTNTPVSPSPTTSDSPTEEVVPPEFDAEVGDELVLGDEIEDESDAEGDGGEPMYRPLAIDPESDLLDYDPSSSYATTDGDWSMSFLDEGEADAAIATTSTYLVEVYLDSPVFFESDPDQNLRWVEENRDRYSDDALKLVREDVQAPGDRDWMLFSDVDDGTDDPSDGGGDDGELSLSGRSAYDLAPHRWSGLTVEPMKSFGAVGGTDDDIAYAWVEYSVSGNLLFRVTESNDENKVPLGPQALQFRASVSIGVIRSPGSEWRVNGISYSYSILGEEPEPLDHPFEDGS